MSINLGQYLHARWAADTTLNGLLDSSKLSTGLAPDSEFPYATITWPGNTAGGWTNDGASLDRIGVRITVYHGRDNYDDGKAIVSAIRNAYSRADFAVGGGGRCINMQYTGDEELQDEEDDWYFVIDFEAQVHTLAGSGA